MKNEKLLNFRHLLSGCLGLRPAILLACLICFYPGSVFPYAHARVTLDKDVSTAKERTYIAGISSSVTRIQLSEPDSVIKMLQSGLRLSRKIGYKYGEALMISGFAAVNEHYSNFSVAVKHQKEALIIFQLLGRKKEAAGAELSLGRLYGKMHLLSLSNVFLGKVLTYYQQSNNRNAQVQTLIALGNTSSLEKKYDKALLYDKMADSLLQGMPLDTNKFVLIEHMAQTEESLGRSKDALEYYELGISSSDNPKFAAWHITLLRKAAELWDRIGNHVNAAVFHEQSLRKAREFKMPEAEVRSQISFASSLRDNNVMNSITHLKNALSLSQSIGSSRLTMEIFRSLSNLYQQQANFKEALVSLKQHQHLLDSLQTVDAGRRLALLEGSFELAENKIHIQNLELSARKQTDQHNVELIIMFGLLLLLGAFAFYYFQTRTLNQRLSRANLTKDKLFSIIGHDLRSPIGGMTQLLGLIDFQDPDDAREMITLAKTQGDKALEILQALLDWGEAQLKGITVSNSVFKPKYFIRRNIELLNKQVQDKGLLVNCQVSEDVKLFGDANHFDFIIRNLLSNAIKFSFAGGEINILASVVKGDRLQCVVRDHGKGISPEQALQFQNANMDVSFGTKGESGTGLGLLLCKEFAKVNGDSLSLERTEGQGASFSFSFKLAPADSPAKIETV